MIQEREPQKEPVEPICQYCGEGSKATWKIITNDRALEFVCDDHQLILKETNAIKSAEEFKWEAEWTIGNHFEEDLQEHEFDDTDQWEDMDSWLY